MGKNIIFWAHKGKNVVLNKETIYCCIKLILSKEVMSEYILVPFENTELMVTKNYQEVLVSTYGDDYMTPKRFDDIEFEVHQIIRDMIEEV